MVINYKNLYGVHLRVQKSGHNFSINSSERLLGITNRLADFNEFKLYSNPSNICSVGYLFLENSCSSDEKIVVLGSKNNGVNVLGKNGKTFMQASEIADATVQLVDRKIRIIENEAELNINSTSAIIEFGESFGVREFKAVEPLRIVSAVDDNNQTSATIEIDADESFSISEDGIILAKNSSTTPNYEGGIRIFTSKSNIKQFAMIADGGILVPTKGSILEVGYGSRFGVRNFKAIDAASIVTSMSGNNIGEQAFINPGTEFSILTDGTVSDGENKFKINYPGPALIMPYGAFQIKHYPYFVPNSENILLKAD